MAATRPRQRTPPRAPVPPRDPSFADQLRCLGRLGRPRELWTFARCTVVRFLDNDLLTSASAMSYQALFAIVPLALAGLSILGFFNLHDIWRTELAPRVRQEVSEPAYFVINSTVQSILSTQRSFWLTFGSALAIWEVSGVIRATMGATNRIYELEERRGFWHRMIVSLLLAAAFTVALLLATASVQVGAHVAPRVKHGIPLLGGVVEWGLAGLILLLVVGLVLHFAPARPQPIRWVGFASLLSVAAWLGTSFVFGWYVTSLAAYGTIFGTLAIAIVLMTYLYVSAIAFLAAVQTDAELRRLARRVWSERHERG